MTGTITHLQQARGLGTLLGEDGKHYAFRRNDVREVWFHQLTEGRLSPSSRANSFLRPVFAWSRLRSDSGLVSH